MKEVFKLFFSALDRSWRKKKAEIFGVFFRRPFCLRPRSHILYLRDENLGGHYDHGLRRHVISANVMSHEALCGGYAYKCVEGTM